MKTKKMIALTVTILSLVTFSIFEPTKVYANSAAKSLVTSSRAPLQSVSGKVTNQDTKSPISGVNVMYVNNKGTTYTAKTNASGIYTINVPASKYTVKVNHPSYKEYSTNANIGNNKMLKRIDIQLKSTNITNTFSIATEKPSYPVTTNSINIIFKNNTRKESGYGLYYTIEYFNGSSWVKVPLNFSVVAIYKILQPGESRTETFSLFQEQYDYKPGKYRIINGGKSAEFTLTGEVKPMSAITMTMPQNSYPVKTESMKVNITNNTTKESGFGYGYEIEYFNGRAWQKVPLEFAVIDIYLILQPGETRTETINLYQDQYRYVAGKYRVIKTIGNEKLIAEFTLR